MMGENGQLFGWSQLFWQYMDQIGILVGNIFMLASITGLLVAFVRRNSLRRWLHGIGFGGVGNLLEDVNERWSALVFTTSNAEVPGWVMDQVRPRAIALVATEQTRQAANDLIEEARARDIATFGPYIIRDADAPEQSREQTLAALRALRGKGHENAAVDITGGRTPMSIGAFMAAEEMGVPTLYVSGTYKKGVRQPSLANAVLRSISDPKTRG